MKTTKLYFKFANTYDWQFCQWLSAELSTGIININQFLADDYFRTMMPNPEKFIGQRGFTSTILGMLYYYYRMLHATLAHLRSVQKLQEKLKEEKAEAREA